MNPKSKKRLLAFCVSGTALILVLGYGFYWQTHARFLQSTDDAYVGGDVSAISTKVAGYIQEIAVKDNMPVKKGELLIRLDARDYLAALAKAEGEVETQRAALADLAANRQLQQSTIAGSAASVGAAQATTMKMAADSRRYNALAQTVAVSAQIRENAEADYRHARAEESKARADKEVAERQLLVLDAREKQIHAALTQAQATWTWRV